MAKRETLQAIIESKMRREKDRLKSYGTKATVSELVHALVPCVIALMTEARWEEMDTLKHKLQECFPKSTRTKSAKVIHAWIVERTHDLNIGRKSIRNWADKLEKERPWKHVIQQKQ